MTKKSEVFFFVLLSVFGAFFAIFVAPSEIPSGMNEGIFSSSLFPFLSISIIVVFSLIEALNLFIQVKNEKNEVKRFWGKGEFKRAFILIASFLIYIFIIIDLFGFYLSSVLLLLGIIWFLGVKRWWIIPLVSIGVVFFVHFLFSAQLGIQFPKGLLF